MHEIERVISRGGIRYAAETDGDYSNVLMYAPYAPYTENSGAMIDAFYPASNALYLKAKSVIADIAGLGYSTCDYGDGYKPLGERLGIGTMLHNQLLTSGVYGSRITLQAFRVKASFSRKEENGITTDCSSCGKCSSACPTGALSGGKFDRNKCVRNAQNRPESAEKNIAMQMKRYALGCDICQRVCPMNKTVAVNSVCEKLLDKYTLAESLSGGAELTTLGSVIGYNYARRNHLLRNAAWLAAATGDCRLARILAECRDGETLGILRENCL